ncbi:MAG: non-canonical purine NTP pyrophosphatase [Candidatus Norongarragalinales archaeon]
MKKIIFVTTNKGKADEVCKIMRGFKVSVKSLSLREDYSLPHEKLVTAKARHAFELLGKPLVVEDTILLVDGFKGYPGLKTKDEYQRLGLEGFLKKCGGRNAVFRTLAAFFDGRAVKLFEGNCEGRISKAPGVVRAGVNPHLPFLRVFIPDGFEVPVSEFSKKNFEKFMFERNHRAKAFKKLAKWLSAKLH